MIENKIFGKKKTRNEREQAIERKRERVKIKRGQSQDFRK